MVVGKAIFDVPNRWMMYGIFLKESVLMSIGNQGLFYAWPDLWVWQLSGPISIETPDCAIKHSSGSDEVAKFKFGRLLHIFHQIWSLR